jgi:hypothetical protein
MSIPKVDFKNSKREWNRKLNHLIPKRLNKPIELAYSNKRKKLPLKLKGYREFMKTTKDNMDRVSKQGHHHIEESNTET